MSHRPELFEYMCLYAQFCWPCVGRTRLLPISCQTSRSATNRFRDDLRVKNSRWAVLVCPPRLVESWVLLCRVLFCFVWFFLLFFFLCTEVHDMRQSFIMGEHRFMSSLALFLVRNLMHARTHARALLLLWTQLRWWTHVFRKLAQFRADEIAYPFLCIFHS